MNKPSPLSALINRRAPAASALTNDSGEQLARIALDLIDIKQQVRETFETEDQTLADLAADIADRGILSPITLRPMGDRYELVCGERRYRASIMAGLADIPAIIKTMTDEEAADAQLAENIQRLNLALIEEAKQLQRDLDQLGSVDAVLQKHHKNKVWLSKRLNLLKLPETAKSLLTEGITADLETVNAVAVVEKIDPEAAKAAKDEMKANPKADKRAIAKKHKDTVKPPKQEKAKPAPASAKGKNTAKNSEPDADESDTELTPGAKALDADFAISDELRTELDTLFEQMRAGKLTAKESLEEFQDVAPELYGELESLTFDLYQAGVRSKNVSRVVAHGLMNRLFAERGAGMFALTAFLQGVERESKYSLIDIVASVRG